MLETLPKPYQARHTGSTRFRVINGEKVSETQANEPLNDQLLVERARNGDQIAFSELVNRHYGKATRVAFGVVKSREDAEDVVQDAFAKVYKKLKDFEGNSSFSTWFFRIVVNQAIDYTRKKKRRRISDVADEDARDALSQGERLWSNFDGNNPEAHTERLKLQNTLKEALSDLPDIHRAVLVLREVEGFSYDEIAETMKIKKGTVMSRLFHARKAMQKRLADADKHNELSAVRGS